MRDWKKLLTGGALVAAASTLAMGAAVAASGLGTPNVASLPRLERLGSHMNLNAAQQQQWESTLQLIAQARDLMQTQNQALLGTAQTELKKPDADLASLTAQMDQNQARAEQARLLARQAFLAFYTAASPVQQAQLREFMLDKLELLGRFSAMRRAGGFEG